MLLNNNLFVFKPNSPNYQNTKSLRYIWQIEWKEHKIIDFYIKNDGEIYVLNKSGVYKMDFEERDGKLLIR
jgi:hypothetical protein